MIHLIFRPILDYSQTTYSHYNDYKYFSLFNFDKYVSRTSQIRFGAEKMYGSLTLSLRIRTDKR